MPKNHLNFVKTIHEKQQLRKVVDDVLWMDAGDCSLKGAPLKTGKKTRQTRGASPPSDLRRSAGGTLAGWPKGVWWIVLGTEFLTLQAVDRPKQQQQQQQPTSWKFVWRKVMKIESFSELELWDVI